MVRRIALKQHGKAPDEAPLAHLARLAGAMDTIAARRDSAHVESCPALQWWEENVKEPEPEPALPFAGDTVPHDAIVQIAERLSTEPDTSPGYFAEEYCIPLPVLMRLLADLQRRCHEDNRRRAQPRFWLRFTGSEG